MTYGHIAAGALALVAAGVAVTPPALAQQSKQTTQTKQTTRAPDRTPQTPQQDLSTLRADIDALKQSYEARLNELEARLAKAEAETAEAKADAADAKSGIDQVASAQPAPPPSAPSSQNAFNPGIAAVLNGFGVLAKHDPANLDTFLLFQGAERTVPAKSKRGATATDRGRIAPYMLVKRETKTKQGGK